MRSVVESPAEMEEAAEEVMYAATGTESASGLKQVASERVEAHRRRRAAAGTALRAAEPQPVARASRAGTSRVREAVAERYRNSVSYREFLAQEAERALEQAQAEAEVAARNARAVAEAQMQLLEELQQWEQEAPSPRQIAIAEHRAEMRDTLAHAVADIAVAATELMEQESLLEIGKQQNRKTRKQENSSTDEHGTADREWRAAPAAEVSSAGWSVRLYEDLNVPRPPVEGARARHAQEQDPDEVHALDEEIAFRRAPEFEPPMPEPVGISGNVIEFPRQLVAARRVRPRLAEGPLRDEAPNEPQLRIFEVEPELLSTVPEEPLTTAPEWQGILLEGAQAPAPERLVHREEHATYVVAPQTARMELRLMAAAVDACCLGAAMVAFASVVVELCGARLHELPLPMIAASAGGAAVALFVLFQVLFFTLNEATPGMRYARIGLCTFADANPTRSAMRLRLLSIMLAVCPLGLGFLWAALDEDGLGWHDRMSRMYQREY